MGKMRDWGPRKELEFSCFILSERLLTGVPSVSPIVLQNYDNKGSFFKKSVP